MMASTATTAIPHKAMTEKRPRNPGSTVAIIFFISMAIPVADFPDHLYQWLSG